jgi:Uma2 family endonuclease
MTPTEPAAPTPATHGPRAADPWFYGWRYVRRTRPDGTTYSEQVPLTSWDVLHPQEDDFIVANDAHDRIRLYLKAVFRWRLADRPGGWLVLGDHRVDWQTAGLIPHGPDVTVLSGSGPWDPHRGTYPVRDMGATPALVVEITSPSTREKDLDEKVTHYWRAGVPQYVIIDSREEDAGWQVVFLAYTPGPSGPVRAVLREPNRAWLPALDLWLAAEGDQVVCLLPDGTPVGDFTEAMRELQAAERRAEAERRRADAERRRADEERRLREAERRRADAEQQRADAAERRTNELEAELRRLRGENP